VSSRIRKQMRNECIVEAGYAAYSSIRDACSRPRQKNDVRGPFMINAA
jgi:hypothetical protein